MSTRQMTSNRLIAIFAMTLFNAPIVSALEEDSCMQDAKTDIAQNFCRGALSERHIDQSMLGYMYLNRAEDIQPSKSKGFYWLREASRNCINYGFGEVNAIQKNVLIQTMFDTGMHYYQGIGTEKNAKNAFFWFEKAANQGHLSAYKQLAKMTLEGVGTQANLQLSIQWTLKAAEKKDPDAQFKMGLYYETGQGIKANKINALKWYQKACKQNKQAACTAYDNLLKSIK